ncbi:MAG TPA: ABC transporter [Treponema sp.]|nr:ABC transporter [Treponema sp.]
MKNKDFAKVINVLALAVFAVVFITPFVFMFLMSLKDKRGANLLGFTLPDVYHFDNYLNVLKYNHYQVLTAFRNSITLTFFSVVILIACCSSAGFVIQRRRDFFSGTANSVILAGLVVPVSILPTIWILQQLHLYKTMAGMILIEVTINIPFTVMLYRSYMASVPVELEEAACIDGCSPFATFMRIIFPLLQPVSATIIILNSVTIFNDFTNPLYFLPGSRNVTVQLTLYNFISQSGNSYNLLFADAILITIPMFILFVFFNKKIIAGMSAGAVKG